jgi:hypothetical protein
MTKVRVSEETSNLSHTSNLISAIGLENSSPSLMRSIRVEGRIHSWVVDSFLREQEREHFRAAREQPFLRVRAHIPRQQTSTKIEAARTVLKAGRTVRIEQAVQQEEQAQKSRQGTVQQKMPYCMDSVWSVPLLLWHRFREEIAVLFFGSFGTFSKAAVQHLLLCFGLRQLARISR